MQFSCELQCPRGAGSTFLSGCFAPAHHFLAAIAMCPANATTTGYSTANRENRSEEHTSELQSLMRISYAVFCLQKKKKQNTQSIHTIYNATPKQRNHCK